MKGELASIKTMQQQAASEWNPMKKADIAERAVGLCIEIVGQLVEQCERQSLALQAVAAITNEREPSEAQARALHTYAVQGGHGE